MKDQITAMEKQKHRCSSLICADAFCFKADLYWRCDTCCAFKCVLLHIIGITKGGVPYE